MKHFISSGVFWLPADRTREVPGQVTFDADGVTLTLQGSLRAPAVLPGAGGSASPEWASEPVAHGQLHGGTEVTLLDLDGRTMPFRLHEETWRAGFALSGGLTEADAFDVARFEFDALLAWADPPGIAAEGPPSERVVIDPRSATVAETELADQTRLCLRTGVAGTWSHDRIHLDQWCAFEASGIPLPMRRVLGEWVRPLQDLLIVCLGRPVRLTSLFVRSPGADERSDSLEVRSPRCSPRRSRR